MFLFNKFKCNCKINAEIVATIFMCVYDIHLVANLRTYVYRWLCEKICSNGLADQRAASIIGAVCRESAMHQVGSIKLRSVLFKTAQEIFESS